MAIPFPQWAAWRDDRQAAIAVARVCVCCLAPLTGFHSAARMTTREDRDTGKMSAGRYYDPEIIKVGCVISYNEECLSPSTGMTLNIGGKDVYLESAVSATITKVYRPVCISGPGCPDCQYLYVKCIAAAMAQADVAPTKDATIKAIHPAQYDSRGLRLPTATAAHLPYTTTKAGVKHQGVREAWIDVSDRIIDDGGQA